MIDVREQQGEIVICHVVRDSPMCTVKIEGQSYKALFDSGSEVSCLRSSLVAQLQRKGAILHWDKKASDRKVCRSANGVIMKTKGVAVVRFYIDGKEFCHSFLVVDHLTQSILVGMDFMKEHEVTLDFSRRSPHIQHIKQKMRSQEDEIEGKQYRTFLREELTLKPWENDNYLVLLKQALQKGNIF